MKLWPAACLLSLAQSLETWAFSPENMCDYCQLLLFMEDVEEINITIIIRTFCLLVYVCEITGYVVQFVNLIVSLK